MRVVKSYYLIPTAYITKLALYRPSTSTAYKVRDQIMTSDYSATNMCHCIL